VYDLRFLWALRFAMFSPAMLAPAPGRPALLADGGGGFHAALRTATVMALEIPTHALGVGPGSSLCHDVHRFLDLRFKCPHLRFALARLAPLLLEVFAFLHRIMRFMQRL
jgi:hypothetical protein